MSIAIIVFLIIVLAGIILSDGTPISDVEPLKTFQLERIDYPAGFTAEDKQWLLGVYEKAKIKIHPADIIDHTASLLDKQIEKARLLEREWERQSHSFGPRKVTAKQPQGFKATWQDETSVVPTINENLWETEYV